VNATAGYLLALAQVVLDLALAPGLVGLIRWLKARLQNRRGAPIWQPYLELRKLFAKEVLPVLKSWEPARAPKAAE